MTAWIDALEALESEDGPAVDEVRLVDFPVDLGIRQQRRTTDLMRELRLIELGSERADGSSTPGRLLALAEGLYSRFGPALEHPREDLERAARAGVGSIEARYRLYAQSPEAMLAYARMMEDADAFCRTGLLMNLEPDPEVYALRRWTVEEFVRQFHGQPLRPWPPVTGSPSAG